MRQRLGWSHLRDVLTQVCCKPPFPWLADGERLVAAFMRSQQPEPHHSHSCSVPSQPVQEGQPGGKLATYVLSLGRPLYIQVRSLQWMVNLHVVALALGLRVSCSKLTLPLSPCLLQTAWQLLDPAGGIIARHEFGRKVSNWRGALADAQSSCDDGSTGYASLLALRHRHTRACSPAFLPHQVNSARPDGVYWCPEKTPCIGVGLRSIFDQASAPFRVRGPGMARQQACLPGCVACMLGWFTLQAVHPGLRTSVHTYPLHRTSTCGWALCGLPTTCLRCGLCGQGAAC